MTVWVLRCFSCKVVGYTGETDSNPTGVRGISGFSCKVVGYTGETPTTNSLFLQRFFEVLGSNYFANGSPAAKHGNLRKVGFCVITAQPV